MNIIQLQERIDLNFKRLNDDIYQINNIFQPESYSWQGDWEGRALLAFVCLYRLTGKEIPCMHQMVSLLEDKTGGKGYFGNKAGDIANEQQLSGHSWYLRGLIAYDKEFPSDKVKGYMKNTFRELYKKATECYAVYPLDQGSSEAGGVSGERRGVLGCWELSTDIGCAFMAVDGVSDYYEYTGDADAKRLLEIMIDVCMRFDRLSSRAQTHATLSAARGILRFYRCTGEKKYLEYSKKLLELYEKDGMTLTYENYNWFLRPRWTEPCCIIDSLILSVELYRVTEEEHYLTLARRILHNGMAFCQRSNGGAGTDSCVTEDEAYLYTQKTYEAYFCCTMRFSEGLVCALQNKDILFSNTELTDRVLKDEQGRYFCGDILLCEDVSEDGATDGYISEASFDVDGKTLIPIISLYKLSEEKAKKVRLKILFK